MKTLVCNAGSSSLKFSLFEAEGELLLAEGGIDWSTTPTRLVVRCTGRPEVCEELTLWHHADAIVRILANSELREELSARSRTAYETHFAWSAIAKKFAALLRKK